MSDGIVRCKFLCTGVEKTVDWPDKTKFLYKARFSVVTGGSEENKAFFKWTPFGACEIGVYTEDCFIPGVEYHFDIGKAVSL